MDTLLTKQRITLKLNNGKEDTLLYSDTYNMNIPKVGEYISYNKNRYVVERITTNINIFDKNNTIGEFDRVSYYVSLKLVDDNYKEHNSSSISKKDMEELKKYISNIEFKVSTELDDDSDIASQETLLSIKDKLDKIYNIIDPPKENIKAEETDDTKTLIITRKFIVRRKAGKGYSKTGITEFEIPGMKLKTKEVVNGKVYKSSSGEINYLDEHYKDGDVYRGTEINSIYIDMGKLMECGIKESSEDIENTSLDQWIQLSIKYPEYVKISNHIDTIDNYKDTCKLMIYHKINK